jgi:general secretion pathway protein L
MPQPRTALISSLQAAWRWWIGELAALVPAALRRRLSGGGGRMVLILLGDGTAELVTESAARTEALGRLDLDPAIIEETREILASQRSRFFGSVRGFSLRLPAAAALRSTMTLPLAAQGNLAQVVSFEIDRRTPFKSDEIYHAHRLLKRDTATQKLTVELTVVPRAVVDEGLSVARDLGIEPDRVEAAGGDPTLPPSGNLLPVRAQPLGARLPQVALAALAIVAVALAATVAVIPNYRAHSTADALAVEMADAKRQAEESARLQREIEAEMQESGFLATRKHDAPVISEILYTLTHLLPDDTWLTELQMSSTDVQLSGVGASASTVLGLLAQTPRFATASFRSPVIQDQRTSREQFNIGAKIAEPGR